MAASFAWHPIPLLSRVVCFQRVTQGARKASPIIVRNFPKLVTRRAQLRSSCSPSRRFNRVLKDGEHGSVAEEAEGGAASASSDESKPEPPAEATNGPKEAEGAAAAVEEQGGAEAGGPQSPQTPLQPPPELLPLPKAVIEVLRNQVFGFDTFFITEQEPFEGGARFKGNLRGEPDKAFAKLQARLKDKFGDEYRVFLLEGTDEDDRPEAAVVPTKLLEIEKPPVPEWATAIGFGAGTVITILLRCGFIFDIGLPLPEAAAAPLSTILLGSSAIFAALAAHEAGHLWAARRLNISLSPPFFLPGLQLGTFGAITLIKDTLRNRSELFQIAAAGPAAGGAVAFVLLLAGLILPPIDPSFAVVLPGLELHDSFLVGGLLKLVLGDAVSDTGVIALNPLLVTAWYGLLVNALQMVPVGELDGGRVAYAAFGRKTSNVLSAVSFGLLGLAGIFNDIALYFLIYVIFLQRGPVPPAYVEVEQIPTRQKVLGIVALLVALAVLLPYPFPFSALPTDGSVLTSSIDGSLA